MVWVEGISKESRPDEIELNPVMEELFRAVKG